MINSKKNGFTLTELLIVATIIIILTVMVTVNYRSSQRQLALQRASYKLGQDIRKVQSMAGLEESRCKKFAGNEFHPNYQYGYGIFLKTDPDDERKKYILFADCDGGERYNAGNAEIIETIEFEKGVETESLNPGNVNNIDIIFVPPDPSVFVDGTSIDDDSDPAVLIIRLEKDTAKTKTITVYKSGLIDAD